MKTENEIKEVIGGLRNLYQMFGSGEVYVALCDVERALEWVLSD